MEKNWQQAVVDWQPAVAGWQQAVAGWQLAVAGWQLAVAGCFPAEAGCFPAEAGCFPAEADWQQAVAGWTLAREEGWQEPLLAPPWWWQVAAAAAWGAVGLRPPWLGEGRVAVGDWGAMAAEGAAKVAADCRAQQTQGRPPSRVRSNQGAHTQERPHSTASGGHQCYWLRAAALRHRAHCAPCIYAMDTGGARTVTLGTLLLRSRAPGRGSRENLRSGRCLTDWAREQLAESPGANMSLNTCTEGCCLPQ